MHHSTADEFDHLYSGLDLADTETAVSVILKLRGETCDIDCLYCYEKRKEAQFCKMEFPDAWSPLRSGV